MTEVTTGIDQKTWAELEEIAARYPQKRSGLLPMLHLVQSVQGRVTPEGIEACADILGISAADVSGVATFYTMYKRRPVGDYHVGVCTNTLCAVMGGDAILSRLKDHLDVGNDETAERRDGDAATVSLEHVECNAACDYAPVMMVNWEFMDNMTPESAVQLVDDLRSGAEVHSTRGPRLCTWREAERVLAGFPDDLADEGPAAGPASLVGLGIARERGWTAPDGPAAAAVATTYRWSLRRSGGPPPTPAASSPSPRSSRRRAAPTRPPPRRRRASDHPIRILAPLRFERGPRMSTLTPVLTDNWGDERSWTLQAYEGRGGYGALKKALGQEPAAIIEQVKDSGLRGRGGAGFPTGMKWGFIPQDNPNPKYLVVNADESEPGTCKDIPLMMANPHVLVEGVAISSYAIRAHTAFIYIRGEVLHVIRRVQRAVQEAYLAGHLGKDIHGSGYDLDVVVHAGAGAYICGEETALLEGLEGRRGQPRLRPPFPAVAGLYASPTVINNVESIASVPSIVEHGPEWFASMGTEKSKGFGIFSLSGHVVNPGQFEAPLGITLRELIDLAGGMREGHQLKFWTPGGSSTPLLTDQHLDVPLDFEAVGAVGSMLGTRALQIFDETTCVVRAVLRWTEFYKHESCGKCTPCREGTWWLVQTLARLEKGEGREEDLDLLLDQCDNILGRSFCALGDGATSPISSSIQYFRDEYLAHLTHGGCPFDAAASTVFAPSPAGASA